MATMEATIFFPGSLVWVSFQPFWPIECGVVPDLHQFLTQWSIQWGEVDDLPRWRPRLPVIFLPIVPRGLLSSVKLGVLLHNRHDVIALLKQKLV